MWTSASSYEIRSIRGSLQSASMQLNPAIFKAYDIRGTTPTTLNEAVAERLGLAFGQRALALGERVVAVGRDGRLSGPALAEALMRGLVAAGVEVIDIGLATTPMLYFAASTLCTSGIQVTGSHNPRDDNGFKMVLAGRAIHGDEIQALRRAMEAGDGERRAGGSVRRHDVFAAYLARIQGDIRLARPMKVVVDCGNGVAGASAPQVFRAIGCEVIELFTEVDGNFPNHHPDPSKPDNLRDVIAALQASDAELGLAFDGDGDRLGIVTRDGQNIFPDRQLVLFARDVLARVPGAPIVFDVKCSQQLAPAIEAAGGVPLMYKTGHSLIKAKMKETNAALAGEMSGHIFFADRFYGFDDATYAACRVLEILSKTDKPLSQLLADLPPTFSTPELRVDCPDEEKFAVVQRIADHFATTHKVLTIDGARILFENGWGLVRASNTQAILVLRFEADSPEALNEIRSTVEEQVAAALGSSR